MLQKLAWLADRPAGHPTPRASTAHSSYSQWVAMPMRATAEQAEAEQAARLELLRTMQLPGVELLLAEKRSTQHADRLAKAWDALAGVGLPYKEEAS